MVRKLYITIVFALGLAVAVYATFFVKERIFGTTPFFYSVYVGIQYAVDSLSALAIRPQSTNAAALSDATAEAIPVLTYHRVVSDSSDVSNVTESRFKDQMITLKNAGWNAVSLGDFESFMRGERKLPERSFLITFDDGAKQSFYPVDPILKALDFHAANYIIVRSSEIPDSTYYLSQAEIQRMLENGRWSIGSHSYDGHRPYPADERGSDGIFFADKLWVDVVDRVETTSEFTHRVRTDLSRAKKRLESTYNIPIRTFAFPLGNETGITGAGNFPEGASITQSEADTEYEFGFLQLENQTYTFNVPRTRLSASTSTPSLAQPFIARRVHVDYDWDGARLLEIMENGLAKNLPFEDDFSKNNGWILSWGEYDIGRNNLTLRASSDSTSGSTFLDGSAFWDNYTFEAALNWQHGSVFILADVIDSTTYHACAYSPGEVHIQSVVRGATTDLTIVKDERIAYGENVHAGIRVHGSGIECTWNFESIAGEYSRDFSGGIGIQTWDESPGAASVQIISAIARPFPRE